MQKNGVVFGLVHGAWHGAWCWEFLQKELDTLGYESVAMDLPIDNPKATFDDYADVVVDNLKGTENVVLVGHSRGGNIIPRAAGRLAASKLIFLASSFEPATTGRPTKAEIPNVPARNSEQFLNGITYVDKELALFNVAAARKVFFHDCSTAVQNWAISRFRPQRRSQNEPILDKWPAVPQEYIACGQDAVIHSGWSHYVARNWLGIEPVEFDSGHSPFLSKPKELAELLVSLAEK